MAERHVHEWTVIDAAYPASAMGIPIKTTLLLQRCVCGEHTTRGLAGYWPRERFIEQDQPAPDLHKFAKAVASEIEAEQGDCRDHPMPLAKPSCPTCARNGAFHRAARIVRDTIRGDHG